MPGEECPGCNEPGFGFVGVRFEAGPRRPHQPLLVRARRRVHGRRHPQNDSLTGAFYLQISDVSKLQSLKLVYCVNLTLIVLYTYVKLVFDAWICEKGANGLFNFAQSGFTGSGIWSCEKGGTRTCVPMQRSGVPLPLAAVLLELFLLRD